MVSVWYSCEEEWGRDMVVGVEGGEEVWSEIE